MSRTADLRGLAREAREGILTSIAALAQPLVVGSSVEAEHLLGLYQALSALQALDDELDVSQPKIDASETPLSAAAAAIARSEAANG
ncbi:MAG: hypothetical protein KC776_34440 [Myxococcales bacterium]|nr:hypothetical protein [Myxococcales bacterium]MCB9581006.1 hypothetical protein [Polyangiaceae bacterium]